MHIKLDNVIYNKSSIIERSLNRMIEEFYADEKLENYTHIDAMILNIERACQAAIDLSQHIVASNHLGIPQTSSESFILLNKSNIISTETMRSMVSMTGFRNIAIHEYQELEMDILRIIATKEYKSLISFCKEIGILIKVRELHM